MLQVILSLPKMHKLVEVDLGGSEIIYNIKKSEIVLNEEAQRRPSEISEAWQLEMVAMSS